MIVSIYQMIATVSLCRGKVASMYKKCTYMASFMVNSM